MQDYILSIDTNFYHNQSVYLEMFWGYIWNKDSQDLSRKDKSKKEKQIIKKEDKGR